MAAGSRTRRRARSLRWAAPALAAGAVPFVATSGCVDSLFGCTEADQCQRGGELGRCQAAGYCSFEDDGCSSGQRYGGLAPDGLAHTCVPGPLPTQPSLPAGAAETTGSGPFPGSTGEPSPDATTAATDADAGEGVPPEPTSTGPAQPGGGSSSEGADESSGEAGAPDSACCDTDCGTCTGGQCDVEWLATSPQGEVRFLVRDGDRLLWSTGSGGSIDVFDLGTQERAVLVQQNAMIYPFAVHGDWAYFWGASPGALDRVSVQTGEVQRMTAVTGSSIVPRGRIAVDDTHVYFANEGTGGVWRIGLEQPGGSAELVAPAGRPRGVAVDDASVYFTDLATGAVRRVRKADEPGSTAGTLLAQFQEPGPVLVDETQVYVGHLGSVSRFPKSEDPVATLAVYAGNGSIADLAVDASHLYFTDSGVGVVARVPKDGGQVELLAGSTTEPRGIALGCGEVFWVDGGFRAVLRRRK